MQGKERLLLQCTPLQQAWPEQLAAASGVQDHITQLCGIKSPAQKEP
jgi:hypothetical protein